MNITSNIHLAVEACFEELIHDVKIYGPNHCVDHHLLSLHHLLGKNFSNALKIVDEGGVSNLEAKGSGRIIYMVQGKTEQYYTVFPGHYCSCQAFFYEVCQGNALYCKHQLAARMASIMKQHKSACVSGEELAVALMNNVVPRVS
ncbi:hypothetical protein CEUSTIGMA_g1685.t1 [Chlamydomonas eustigma]|uniref:SWIM-type domain-containing protein n=1 Tax=Chlamydomonas eustigma TaxID=1157962 RepID=A0A250WU15_9CHLO|nr:hypothetical protein CEUSTIGMA_g1685.t1 [Chlamydomonas eustigma]|eukprot:GAX74236.1 hypothetical protein CEUSTIGMA_g1685.t1 [Chlamydomonas eustigma]